MTLITLRQAAVRFELSYYALRRIAAAGLLPEAGQHGDKLVISTDVAQRIRACSAGHGRGGLALAMGSLVHGPRRRADWPCRGLIEPLPRLSRHHAVPGRHPPNRREPLDGQIVPKSARALRPLN